MDFGFVFMRSGVNPRQWLNDLGDEEISFLKRFVLASGSMKDLAAEYRISYPTVRLRLDRLIQKIRIFDDVRVVDPFERHARGLYAEGKLGLEELKSLLAAHRASIGQVTGTDGTDRPS